MRTAWPHFSEAELKCRCGRPSCPIHGMGSQFMARLELLRSQIDVPLPLTSAYRCPEHNAEVSTTGVSGPHTQGRAVDVRLSGEPVVELVRWAIEAGFTGIGLHQKGAHGQRFVHLDDLKRPDYPRPRIWTY